jgi:hypothetical protein
MEWIRSHLKGVIGALFAVIIGPLLVLFIVNAVKRPDVTVEELKTTFRTGRVVHADVDVYNAGEVTAKDCYVTVTDKQTQKDVQNYSEDFELPPGRPHTSEISILNPTEPPRGDVVWVNRRVLIRAECSNDDSDDIERTIIFAGET